MHGLHGRAVWSVSAREGEGQLSLRQMEYFVTVVQETSFTRAADALHVTQPALSHQIKALERSVGGPLLERLPRGVRLTPMGRAFLPHAELAVRSAAQARRAARAAAGAEGGELHVAALHSLAVGALPDVFARWRTAHPEVLLRLHEYATADALEEAVQRGTADLAVGPEPVGRAGTVVPVGEEEVVLVVPFDDRLAGRTTVTLPELAGHAWIRCAMEPVVHGELFLDRVCGRAGSGPGPPCGPNTPPRPYGWPPPASGCAPRPPTSCGAPSARTAWSSPPSRPGSAPWPSTRAYRPPEPPRPSRTS